MRRGWAALAALVVVPGAGCSAPVAGSASPVPGQRPAEKADPCSLLDAPQATALGYQYPGKARAADKSRKLPPVCTWEQTDRLASPVLTGTVWSVDVSLEDFTQGALQKGQPERIGNLFWTRYGTSLPDSCDRYVTLGPLSFVAVQVSGADEDSSCKLSATLAAQVAAHLPGGATAPPSTPASTTPPLADLPDPCTLLDPGDAGRLKVTSPGQPQPLSTDPSVPGCVWGDTDGEGGYKPVAVFTGKSLPATNWPGLTGGTPVDVDGRKWTLFPNAGGTRIVCSATHAVSPTASVMVTSGNLDDTAKMCDQVNAALPLVSARLPA